MPGGIGSANFMPINISTGTKGKKDVSGVYNPNITQGMSMEDQRKELERADKEAESAMEGYTGIEAGAARSNINQQRDAFRQRQADETRKNQIGTVEKLEKDAPEIAGRAFSSAALGERRKLAEEMSGIKRGAQRRGLLYSGMKQGAEAGAQAGSAARLAQARVDINRNVGSMVQDAKNKVIQGGLDLQAGQQAMEDAIYSQALANYQSKVGAGSAIGGGLGMVAGALL
jgi:DNA repair exonuclease SbcCD ATPase subunit